MFSESFYVVDKVGMKSSFKPIDGRSLFETKKMKAS